MRTLTAITSVLVTTFFSVASYAQEQPAATPDALKDGSSGEVKAPSNTLELGARLGYSLPAGSTMGNESLSDGFSGQLPVQMDVGYRINPHFYVGAYGQLGYAFPKGDCSVPGVSCSGLGTRLGINAQYHVLPDAKFDPWIGVGTGYEWLTAKMSGGNQTASATAHGFELVNLQIGGDYRVSKQFAIGPFASLSLGQFSKQSTSINGQDLSGDIQNTALHEWITLGVKGTFDL
jgi:opacity protein-like surface antigen